MFRIGRTIALVALVVCIVAVPAPAQHALDDYVAAPDPAYSYRLAERFPDIEYTTYVLEMTSQKWRTEAEVNRTEWKHWITIVVPRRVTTSTGLLFVSGGRNGGSAPAAADRRVIDIARYTGAVVADLGMIPNQPLVFAGERRGRTEDSLIAYAWDKYLRTGDSKWLPRLPMTKAVVGAMDAVSDFMKSDQGGGLTVDRYVVAGGSKRGWTAWTTAAVDQRIVAIVPMVIDVLNIEPSMIHHYRAYGAWSEAIADYERMGIMEWIGTPQFRALAREVDPYSFRDRYTMPKFIINSTGDQFFLPDSSQFYFDDLPGEKHLHYVPNSDHSLNDNDVFESLVTNFWAIIHDKPRPKFSWQFPDGGGIVVQTEDKPSQVTLWTATDHFARDFRLEKIGAAWKPTALTPVDGAYRANPPKPDRGWTAYFIALTFPSGGRFPFRFTTAVRVTPDTLPFPPPDAKQE